MRNNTIKIILFLCIVMTFVFTMSAHADAVLEVGIPGQIETAPGASLPSVPQYIKFIYLFVFGFVGIAGFVSLVIWGTVWTASGIVDKKAAALSNIKNTFIGIGLALSAFIILNTINPELVILRTPAPPKADITASNISPAVKGTWLCPEANTTGMLKLSGKTICKSSPKPTCFSGTASCYLRTKTPTITGTISLEGYGNWFCLGDEPGGITNDWTRVEETWPSFNNICIENTKVSGCAKQTQTCWVSPQNISKIPGSDIPLVTRCGYSNASEALCDTNNKCIWSNNACIPATKKTSIPIPPTPSSPVPTPSSPSPSTACSEKGITECVPDSTCNWIGIFGPCEDV